ncbi:MAG TPA: radical SAM protein [Mycobacteriales bacterium]
MTDERWLKYYLLANGIRVDAVAESTWLDLYGGPLSLSEYASTSGICLATHSGVYVNAPFIEGYAHESGAVLGYEDGFVVILDGERVPVTVVPVPAFHARTFVDDGREVPYTNVGVTHTDRCRISPIEGCAWHCHFCDLPYEFRYRKKRLEHMVEVIELAAVDPLAPARHVLVSGGTPTPDDEAWIDEVYETLASRSVLPVDVMMPPREDRRYPAWLRDAGVNMLSVNLEIYDEKRARRLTPNKSQRFGPAHYLDYIETAVEAFGIGRVQSLMVFGAAIEPIDSTIEGIRRLVQRGCVPVLSPFRPDSTTPLRDAPHTTVEEMHRVYEATWEICVAADNGVRPGPRCVPCQHNTVAFPDGEFYIPLDQPIGATCVI